MNIEKKPQIAKSLIMIGDSGAGKTCICNRYFRDVFTSNASSTSGVAFERKKFDYEHAIIDLKVYDTAGQEVFHSITKSYYQKSDGVIFVFAINNLDSFSNIKNWMHDVKKHLKPNYMKLLVGTKADLEEERQIKKEEIHNFAKENDFDYIEASAKTKINISEIFIYFAKQIHDNFSKGILDEKKQMEVVDEKKQKEEKIILKLQDDGKSERSCC